MSLNASENNLTEDQIGQKLVLGNSADLGNVQPGIGTHNAGSLTVAEYVQRWLCQGCRTYRPDRFAWSIGAIWA